MGVGLGKVLLNMVPSDIETIVLAGHGPPNCREVDRFLKRYPNAHITVFEPQRDFFKKCNDKYQDIDRITMKPQALSYKDQSVTFHVAAKGGWSSIQPINQCGIECETYMVECTTIDSLGLDHIDLLFLDVQGAEHLVLRGASNMITENRIDVVVGESVFTDLYGKPHSFHIAYELLAVENSYTFVGWYVPCHNEWFRVQYCDYIFATSRIIESVEERHARS